MQKSSRHCDARAVWLNQILGNESAMRGKGQMVGVVALFGLAIAYPLVSEIWITRAEDVGMSCGEIARAERQCCQGLNEKGVTHSIRK